MGIFRALVRIGPLAAAACYEGPKSTASFYAIGLARALPVRPLVPNWETVSTALGVGALAEMGLIVPQAPSEFRR